MALYLVYTSPQSNSIIIYLEKNLYLPIVYTFMFKGTVSRDWNGQLAGGWIKPHSEMNLWKFFITIYCFLFLPMNFTFFRGIAQMLPLGVHLGQPSCKYAIGCWQPSRKFVTVGKRVLATLWQICYTVSEVIGNPLANYQEGISNFCK
jgi:hypothetical protein